MSEPGRQNPWWIYDTENILETEPSLTTGANVAARNCFSPFAPWNQTQEFLVLLGACSLRWKGSDKCLVSSVEGIEPFWKCLLDTACHPHCAQFHNRPPLSSYLNLTAFFLYPLVPSRLGLDTRQGVTVVKTPSQRPKCPHLKPCSASS